MAAGIEVPKRVIALVVLALGFAVSCARMLGEVAIEGKEKAVLGNRPDAGPPPKEVICELGTTECDGRLLKLCTDGGTAWVTWQACATPALCKSDLSTVAACIPPTCALEQMSCAGAELRLCNEDRTGWTVFDTCKTAAHCDAGKRQCLPAPCDPGNRRCNVGELQRCRDDQLDWEKLDACASNEVCEATITGERPGLTNGGLMGNETLPPVVPLLGNSEGPIECISPACLNQEIRCDGARLLACNEGLTGFDVAEECATPVLCDASIAYSGIRGSPRCKRPACDVGKHHCSDTGVLEICNEDRTAFKAIEECIGAPFCSAVAADNGQPGCRDAPCESGEEQCNGADIQRCSADRTRFDTIATCETRGLCDDDNPTDARCNPPACQRGPLSGSEFRCEGAVLQRCNDQHTGYDTLNTCATPGLCISGLGFNGCVPPTCFPGQTRCAGDFLQVCNSQRNGFDNLERCSGGTCDSNAGRCSDPCVVGTARCNSLGQLEECRDRLVGRQVTALCSSPQLCDAAARSCRLPPPGCTADGVHQCVRQGPNTLLQVCSDGRSRFATVDTCTGGEVCDPNNAPPNQNVCDACAQNSQPTCQGNDLVTCSLDGITPSVLPCPNGCQVVENGPDRCRNCVLGSATCNGTSMLVCVSGGATNEFREARPCTTAGACQAALTACNAGRGGENCSCAPGVCTAGQRDCRGNQPIKCADDLLSFVADGGSCGTRVCFPRPGTTQRPAGTCGCTPGQDVKCVGGILQTCTPTGVFEDDPRFIPGGVLCLPGPNGTGQRALGCSGNTRRDDTCGFGCSVEKGCAECDATFRPVCDGPSSRTVCNGGDILEEQPCVGSTSNACLETICEEGACNPNAPREDGTACGTGGLCENGVCARCGDGSINGDEECDTTDALACPAGQVGSIPCSNCRRVNQCRTPTCEDGIPDRGEACQPGDLAQTCPAGQRGSIPCVDCQRVNQCQAPSCEDGVRDPGEACQPGDVAQGCPPGQQGSIPCVNCQRVNQCRIPTCEDGISDPGEACQPGALPQNCPPGQTGSIPCVDCQRVNQCTRIPSCADGIPDPGEGCQPGDAPLACAAGQMGSIPCVDCQRVNQCARVPSCADGIPDPGETCQPGDAPEACPPGQTGTIPCVDCRRVNQCAARVPSCADGIPDPGEACQPGDAELACATGQKGSIPCVNCQRVNQCTDVRVPSCADGIPDPGEVCQPGDAPLDCPAGQQGAIVCQDCLRINQCTDVPPDNQGGGNGNPDPGNPGNGNGNPDPGNGNGAPGNGGNQ